MTPEENMAKVRRNIARMIDQNAPDAEIEAYVTEDEGLTLEAVQGVGAGFKTFADDVLESIPGAARMAGGMIGGAMGGAAGAVAGAPTGPGAVMTAGAGAFTGAVLLAEVFGQAADIAVDYVKDRHKTAIQRGQEAGVNMLTDATMMGVGGALSRMARPAGRLPRWLLRNDRAVQVGRDLADAGADPRGAALLMGSRTTQGLVQMQRSLPIASDIHQRAISRTLDQIAGYADDVARSGGGKAHEAYRAGEIVRGGVEGYSGRSTAEAATRYASIAGLDARMLNAVQIKAAAREMKAEIARGRVAAVPTWLERIIQDTPDRVNFLTARTMRSQLAAQAREMAEPSAARGVAKRLTAKVDEALEAVGEQLDPKSLKDFRAANKFYKDSAQRLERLADVRHGETGIAAWNAAVGGAKKDPARMLDLKKALKPGEWTEYVSARVHDMGLETPGQGAGTSLDFSLPRFLTSFRQLVPEVRDAMFGKSTPIRDGVERLARIAGDLKGSERMANPSGTGGFVATMHAWGAPLTALGMTMSGNLGAAATTAGGWAAYMGGQIGTAELLTSARFVNWLADGMVIAPANYSGTAAHIARLVGIAKVEPALRGALQTYLENLSETDARQAVSAALTGQSSGQTVSDRADKPTQQRFAEALASYEQQRSTVARLPETEQTAWRRDMRNENAVMGTYHRAGKDVAQIDGRLAELQRQGTARQATAERGRLERVRARIMREAEDFANGIYGQG